MEMVMKANHQHKHAARPFPCPGAVRHLESLVLISGGE